jgi:hypothetical protein
MLNALAWGRKTHTPVKGGSNQSKDALAIVCLNAPHHPIYQHSIDPAIITKIAPMFCHILKCPLFGNSSLSLETKN